MLFEDDELFKKDPLTEMLERKEAKLNAFTEKLAFPLLIIMMIAVFLFMFFAGTKDYPTKEDEAKVLEVEKSYRDDYSKALQIAGTTITVSDDGVEVNLKRNNCTVVSYFEADGTYKYSDFKGTAAFVGAWVCTSILFGVVAGFALTVVIMRVIQYFGKKAIHKKVMKLKIEMKENEIEI